MGEKLDSESLREVMTRYFDAMRVELERHGGVVEKYIGDAIMAVFGLPTLHEDDALRAVRAAAGMQQALGGVNDELERQWGVRLTVRTGVNTGEVVAGDPTAGQRLVVGDAVNVAARLEQAAGAQEVLLGDLTYRLVRDYVDVEEVEPLELKGKSEPVPAYRLVGVRSDAERPRRLDAPMVGRGDELAQLTQALGEAEEARRCRLVTVIGEAGVGKSRLIDEFVGSLADDGDVSSRPLPPVRRRHHVLAARGGRSPGSGNRRARHDGVRAGEARNPRGGCRGRGARRGGHRSLDHVVSRRGADLGHAQAAGRARPRPPAPRPVRRRPLGRVDVPGAHRAPGRSGGRLGDPRRVLHASRAARAHPGVVDRAGSVPDRARPALGRADERGGGAPARRHGIGRDGPGTHRRGGRGQPALRRAAALDARRRRAHSLRVRALARGREHR